MPKKICFICQLNDARSEEGVFRFPKDRERLGEWMDTLNLSNNPPENARLCVGHFLPHEIEKQSDGRRFLNSFAVPLKEICHQFINILKSNLCIILLIGKLLIFHFNRDICVYMTIYIYIYIYTKVLT